MASIRAALAAINIAERILRTRYQYEHPIFGHLAEARENLEGLAAEAAPPVPTSPDDAMTASDGTHSEGDDLSAAKESGASVGQSHQRRRTSR